MQDHGIVLKSHCCTKLVDLLGQLFLSNSDYYAYIDIMYMETYP